MQVRQASQQGGVLEMDQHLHDDFGGGDLINDMKTEQEIKDLIDGLQETVRVAKDLRPELVLTPEMKIAISVVEAMKWVIDEPTTFIRVINATLKVTERLREKEQQNETRTE
jgi:F0F1-type ATP synthase beta subunit